MLKKFLYWSPRVLSILFIIFLSVFALDVFSEYQGLKIIPALLIHLAIPLILLIVLVVAWKRDLVGMIIFLVSALYYITMVGFDENWTIYALIPGPAIVIGILFLLNWLQQRKLHE
jgi:hypothetical protein